VVQIAAELVGLVLEFSLWSWCYGQGRTVTVWMLWCLMRTKVHLCFTKVITSDLFGCIWYTWHIE
jgi:hypothetical protein